MFDEEEEGRRSGGVEGGRWIVELVLIKEVLVCRLWVEDDHGTKEHARPFVVRAVDFGQEKDDEEELGFVTKVYHLLVHYVHQSVLEKSAFRNGWCYWQNEGKALGGDSTRSRLPLHLHRHRCWKLSAACVYDYFYYFDGRLHTPVLIDPS